VPLQARVATDANTRGNKVLTPEAAGLCWGKLWSGVLVESYRVKAERVAFPENQKELGQLRRLWRTTRKAQNYKEDDK